MRRVALTLLALALLVVPAAPASASTGRQVKHARDEVTQARALVSQALAEVKAGDRARAYRHARAAYLDHFESSRSRCACATPRSSSTRSSPSRSCATTSATASRSTRCAMTSVMSARC